MPGTSSGPAAQWGWAEKQRGKGIERWYSQKFELHPQCVWTSEDVKTQTKTQRIYEDFFSVVFTPKPKPSPTIPKGQNQCLVPWSFAGRVCNWCKLKLTSPPDQWIQEGRLSYYSFRCENQGITSVSFYLMSYYGYYTLGSQVVQETQTPLVIQLGHRWVDWIWRSPKLISTEGPAAITKTYKASPWR